MFRYGTSRKWDALKRWRYSSKTAADISKVRIAYRGEKCNIYLEIRVCRKVMLIKFRLLLICIHICWRMALRLKKCNDRMIHQKRRYCISCCRIFFFCVHNSINMTLLLQRCLFNKHELTVPRGSSWGRSSSAGRVLCSAACSSQQVQWSLPHTAPYHKSGPEVRGCWHTYA